MEFIDSVHKAPEARDACVAALIEHPALKFYWKPENGLKQWFIDGFSIDATKVLQHKTVLWDSSCGATAPVHESDAVNASPGDLPELYAFMATHAEYGTVLFLPVLNCRGGKKGAWDDVKFWTANLSEDEVKFLKEDMAYYLQPDAWTKGDPDALKAVQDDIAAGKFDSINAKLFLVRTPAAHCQSMYLHTCCRTASNTHCSHACSLLGPPNSQGTSFGAQTTRIGPAQRGSACGSCCATSSSHASCFLTSRFFVDAHFLCSAPPCTSTAMSLPLI